MNLLFFFYQYGHIIILLSAGIVAALGWLLLNYDRFFIDPYMQNYE